ncbi:MAG: malonate transporter subunit MadM [Firmicutes bacterium]|nr:malonate transporter subunit MadM [Bacillota bacterium]
MDLLAFVQNGTKTLFATFGLVAIIMYVAQFISRMIGGRIKTSAIAMIMALALALLPGAGAKGVASIPAFAGFATMGGSMFRDYCILATAFGARIEVIKQGGLVMIISLLIGVIGGYIIGAVCGYALGIRETADLACFAAGCVTFVVGPVTGSAVGASDVVNTLSISAGVVKSVLTMIVTPFLAGPLGINNPKSAMCFGGLVGTTSGTSAGIAAVDQRLVPYTAMAATFYTGLGCLLCPTICYFGTRAILG